MNLNFKVLFTLPTLVLDALTSVKHAIVSISLRIFIHMHTEQIGVPFHSHGKLRGNFGGTYHGIMIDYLYYFLSIIRIIAIKICEMFASSLSSGSILTRKDEKWGTNIRHSSGTGRLKLIWFRNSYITSSLKEALSSALLAHALGRSLSLPLAQKQFKLIFFYLN